MIITKMALPRRTFLRGLGVSLALPLLDAMVPAASALARTAGRGVRRFGVVYVPNGIAMRSWTPTTEGAGFEFTPILKPLEPFRDKLLVLSGMNNVQGGGSHAGRSSGFLTGVTSGDGGVTSRSGEYNIHAGISADQLLARELGKQTELASLEVALESRDTSGSCDVGYSCVYTNTISWRTDTTPLPMEYNPRAVFEQLFGDSGSTDARVRLARIKGQRSILDSVTDRVSALERELGPRDRTRLGEYLEAVRDIERRIQRAEEQSASQLPVLEQPPGVPADFRDHARLMFDLQLLAFRSDLTRIITFMLGREISGRTYPEIGVPEAHHPTSHHREEPELLDKLEKINTYHVELFAEYVEKLRSTSDGDGSLLDHTALIYGAGMSNSNMHDPTNIPVLLLGGGAGIRMGRHVATPKGTPHTNMLLTLLDSFGVPLERLGTSTGKLQFEPLSL
jgi:hypothetical protein